MKLKKNQNCTKKNPKIITSLYLLCPTNSHVGIQMYKNVVLCIILFSLIENIPTNRKT